MNKNLNYKTSGSDRQRANEYYRKNKEKCLLQRKAYYNLHRNEILEQEKFMRASPEYGPIKREYDHARYEKNKDVIKMRQNNYYHHNRPRAKNYLLKKTYGISLGDYTKKWIEQNGKCIICNIGSFPIDKMFDRVLVLDHDHKTNQVRGLLCNSCNRALGLLKDNPTFTQNATNYLNQWRQKYVEPERH